MNFAIIGVGKIGIYHIRDFINNGFKLSAILSSSKERGLININKLKEIYNIEVNYYTHISDLFLKENIDLIVISSPTNTHYEYINKCIEFNIKHIFCEKPFIYNNCNSNVIRCIDIMKNCKKKKIKLCVNTQWVYGVHQIRKYIPKKLKKITLYMEHYKKKEDIDFFTENLSHMNSIIIYLLGIDEIKDLNYNMKEYPININFYYKNVLINYNLGYPHNKQIIFSFNDISFKRMVDKNYNQSFLMNGKDVINIEDPFSLSIKNYIEKKSLLDNNSILKNVELTDLIINHLNKL